MDMELDSPPRPVSRKRRPTQDDENEDEVDYPHYADTTTTPITKRSRAHTGHAISRRQINCNIRQVINTVAWSVLNVSFNYRRYNPATSPVIIILLSECNYTTYLAYCDMVLRLTAYAPDLQALAFDNGLPPESWCRKRQIPQPIPIHDPKQMDGPPAESVWSFVEAYRGFPDIVALLDSGGICKWDDRDLLARSRGPGSQTLVLSDVEALLERQLVAMRSTVEMEWTRPQMHW
ncbi:hypothetical protein LTR62_005567 [Meristemomyces frigidus]|uniref:Uncharacterized protein n=1 Tax=Meristemomyces frigidus TaxID=1508187 RepID=A0AAN7TE88_9PEZI|nr:hypothetical protein LTR62_005567 [Meristemomyces frigidus]